MDTTLAVVLFFINLIAAVVAFFLPKEPTAKQSRTLKKAVVLLGAIGAISTGLQAYRGSKSGEEQTRNMIGDSEHPPFVAVLSLPGFTRFLITNPSDYPAYVTGVQLRDDTSEGGGEPRDYGSREFAAHTAMVDDRPWVSPVGSTQRHFTANITTRTGLYTEEMMLRKDENNQWARAVRVTQGMRTLEEDIDSSWPRKPDGTIEWKR